MKISIVLTASVFAQENSDDANNDAILARMNDYGLYGSDEYFYDVLGNKKKKNKKHPNNEHHHHSQSYHGSHKQSSHGAHSSQAAWSDAVNTQGAHFGFGKGFQYDQDLIGNGRFCWNCFARINYNAETGVTTTAYDNCFGGLNDGFIEMCVGEEYYCNWEERRHKGVIIAVQGGCKSAHSCLRQMTENYRWKVYTSGAPRMAANLCTSGNFGDETQNSVCAWCCDGMPGNLDRFNPATTALCNHKDFNLSGAATAPAYEYYKEGDTNNFDWNAVGDTFNGLYTDGSYHGLFRIHDQLPLGSGVSGPPISAQRRSHPRSWAGLTNNGQ